jgi:hypothetical protein
MNRRGFFKTLAAAAAGFAILPAATTYARNWVAPSAGLGRKLWVPNPEWVTAQYEVFFIDQRPVFDERILDGEPREPVIRYRMANGVFEPVYPWKEA